MDGGSALDPVRSTGYGEVTGRADPREGDLLHQDQPRLGAVAVGEALRAKRDPTADALGSALEHDQAGGHPLDVPLQREVPRLEGGALDDDKELLLVADGEDEPRGGAEIALAHGSVEPCRSVNHRVLGDVRGGRCQLASFAPELGHPGRSSGPGAGAAEGGVPPAERTVRPVGAAPRRAEQQQRQPTPVPCLHRALQFSIRGRGIAAKRSVFATQWPDAADPVGTLEHTSPLVGERGSGRIDARREVRSWAVVRFALGTGWASR